MSLRDPIGSWGGPGVGRGPLRRLTPTQLFVLSFLGLIALGTTGYMVLPGLYTGPGLGFVDALFTATSAVCVTGLIVVDTATYFTFYGQLWTLFLFQAGGLGILTFTSLVVVALGRSGSLALEEAAGAHASYLGNVSAAGLLRNVLTVTFLVEGAGALVLWLRWREQMAAGEALWHAVFQAVSAFCNAGFSTFSDSIVGFRTSPISVWTIAALIVLGGLGFVVVVDLLERYGARRTRRLTVHTRLVLVSTAVLIAAASLLFLLFEWRYDLAGLSPVGKVTNAVFMAVTPRTAGFNTVDYASATNSSLFLTIVLMLIGGSPGSTAGGFKTTTVALLVLLFRAKLRGHEEVSIFNRTVPRETVHRAAGLVVGGIVLLGASVFLLSITELAGAGALDRDHFFHIIFEAHSAFGTVGLSMGATPTLSTAGRLIVTFLMFLGRVGPLAVVAAMTVAVRRKRASFRLGHEDVIIA